jgi:hypothetical protein
MRNQDLIREVLAASEARRNSRRAMLKMAGAASVAAAGAALLAGCDDDGDEGRSGVPSATPTPTPTPTPTSAGPSEGDVLNFALQLEYLEASFYLYAVTGTGLTADETSGTGTPGTVTGGRQVNFTDPIVRLYAREIAADERAHVVFLRNALSTARVAMPSIDIGTAPTGAFSSAARAAGLIGAGASFDPYANDENFLLAAFIFEDVGVTAYKGAVSFINTAAFIEAAAGIHAAEAYHAGLIRTVLYRKGLATPALIDATEAISNARDSLDGDSDLDQGIRPTGTGASAVSNIVPTDRSGIAFSRTPGQVLNIAYLNRQAVSQGGFFPAGLNGSLRTSAAN